MSSKLSKIRIDSFVLKNRLCFYFVASVSVESSQFGLPSWVRPSQPRSATGRPAADAFASRYISRFFWTFELSYYSMDIVRARLYRTRSCQVGRLPECEWYMNQGDGQGRGTNTIVSLKKFFLQYNSGVASLIFNLCTTHTLAVYFLVLDNRHISFYCTIIKLCIGNHRLRVCSFLL